MIFIRFHVPEIQIHVVVSSVLGCAVMLNHTLGLEDKKLLMYLYLSLLRILTT